MAVDVGDEAPDFTLRNQDREEVTLSSFRGEQPVLVVFISFAFSSTCQGELCSLRDELEGLSDVDAQVLAVSVDSPFVQKAWRDEQGYGFPLLADFWPHGEVAREYGVFDEKLGAALRGSFLVDSDGTLAWKTVNGVGEARDLDDYRAALAAL